MSKQTLTFDDALRIARGCTDYGGGYRGSKEYEEYQNGIKTVIRALEAAKKSDLSDPQMFDDALRIASGCIEYVSEYRGENYEAYQDGIETVIIALKAAQKNGLSDHQILALYQLGTK